jgi:preprotein translocase subunit SecY
MKGISVPATTWGALAVGIIAVNVGNFLNRAWKVPIEAAAVGVLLAAVAGLIEALIRYRRR